MKNKESLDINFNPRSLATNSIYNLLGYGIPLLVAIVLIPYLIRGLGDEKFGLLNIVWIVIGYFSFFDFGIGRAITQIVAEKLGQNLKVEIPTVFWTSLVLMFLISAIGTLIVIILTPALVYDVFKISVRFQQDTIYAFYILALSIPVVTTTAGLRGLLEAYQKFGIINVIRTILGIASFVVPLLCLFFSDDLFWIVLGLTVIRIIIWVLYLLQCLKLDINLSQNFLVDRHQIKHILKISGWMTVSNTIVPVIIYIDRFLIGALTSTAALTYYATPYEVINKLLLIPGALTGVLFPAFSSNYLSNPSLTKRLLQKAIKYTFIIVYPLIFLIISFAYEGLDLWLGNNFAESSSLIMQLFAVGVLFNSIAYIPFTFLQGIKKPDIPAKINLIEFPFYVILMWFSIKSHGIVGAAFVWMLRMVVDAIILIYISQRQIFSEFKFRINSKYILILVLGLVSSLPLLISDILLKFIVVIIILCGFLILTWKILFDKEERMFLVLQLRDIPYFKLKNKLPQ